MTDDLIHFVEQSGQNLEAIVNYARALGAVWAWGRDAYGKVLGFVGPRQKKNMAEISGKIQDKIKGIQEERLSEPSPSVAEPLIEAAMQESRPELQEFWAGLLATAMLDGGKNTRYEFGEILAKMSPSDAITLTILASLPTTTWNSSMRTANIEHVSWHKQQAGISDDSWEASLNRLRELGCVAPSLSAQSQIPNPYRVVEPEVTSLGRLFLAAVQPC
ncbi:MAG: DUF4393 domain-containing protein [Alphaproteobacteria bacterium]|nr:DUF4393 domain-containing protein [Alphaproteobacteria bacterium]